MARFLQPNVAFRELNPIIVGGVGETFALALNRVSVRVLRVRTMHSADTPVVRGESSFRAVITQKAKLSRRVVRVRGAV